ncbi:MAG: cytochrome c3 family protein [Phycisphaerales bacterium]
MRRGAFALALGAVVAVGSSCSRGGGDGSGNGGDPGGVSEPVVAAAERPTRVVTFQEGCMTPACHAGLRTTAAVHAPVFEGKCETCHAPDTGGHVFPARDDPASLCGACHTADVDHPVQHLALSDDECLACHDPHGSTDQFLMREKTVAATCYDCHPKERGSSVHEPYAKGECMACHEPHSSDARSLLLGGEGSLHCRECHLDVVAAMATENTNHLQLQGECLACHGSHATDYEHLLTNHSGDQCANCHEDIRKLLDNSLVTHEVARDRTACVVCHDPHSAPNDGMLHADQVDVCLSCHDKAIKADDGRTIPDMSEAIRHSPVVHGPVKAGECNACHSVHGANHARLLREIDPSVLVGPFDIKNYALCFSCHDQALVLEDRTTTATQFRNGDLNLHRAHLALGTRGRGCADCHTIHGGDRPRLIASEVAYERSDWKMPMGFEITSFGGRCSPGCHEPISYDRRVTSMPSVGGEGEE